MDASGCEHVCWAQAGGAQLIGSHCLRNGARALKGRVFSVECTGNPEKLWLGSRTYKPSFSTAVSPLATQHQHEAAGIKAHSVGCQAGWGGDLALNV